MFSLLEQIPQPNAFLLKTLFGILYKIEQNSELNHMTSSNLAVCIALSILCLPASSNSELPDVSRKVTRQTFFAYGKQVFIMRQEYRNILGVWVLFICSFFLMLFCFLNKCTLDFHSSVGRIVCVS